MDSQHYAVIDLQNEVDQASQKTPFSFQGPHHAPEPTNGGRSPANDAYFALNRTYSMFIDYINLPPLASKTIANIHFGNSSAAAFWNGREIFLGDGNGEFFPMVTLDVVAHEIAHGFTEQHSGLSSCQCRLIADSMCPSCHPCPQSAAINEAFSDMVGEAVKFFVYGHNDWQFGANVTKDIYPIRYLDRPSRNNLPAIDHAYLWREDSDPHDAAGVFNRAFYKLAHFPGWNTRSAFAVFAQANAWFWTAGSDFKSAAEDVIDAAAELDMPTCDVRSAFNYVGLEENGRCSMYQLDMISHQIFQF